MRISSWRIDREIHLDYNDIRESDPPRQVYLIYSFISGEIEKFNRLSTSQFDLHPVTVNGSAEYRSIGSCQDVVVVGLFSLLVREVFDEAE